MPTQSPRDSNGRMARFTNGFFYASVGAPPESLRFADNGLFKQTLLRQLEPVRQQRMELRKQRLLEHAERKERHAQQQKEYREKRRLQKEYEEAYRQDLARQDAAVRLLQLYARRAASIHDIATGSGPMQLNSSIVAEEVERRKRASAVIQRCVRDWVERSKRNPALRARRQFMAACQIQALARRFLSNRRTALVKAKTVLDSNLAWFDTMLSQLQEDSARLVQKLFRGRAARRAVARRRLGLQGEVRMVMAVVRMQTGWRKKKAREAAKKKRAGKKQRRGSMPSSPRSSKEVPFYPPKGPVRVKTTNRSTSGRK